MFLFVAYVLVIVLVCVGVCVLSLFEMSRSLCSRCVCVGV